MSIKSLFYFDGEFFVDAPQSLVLKAETVANKQGENLLLAVLTEGPGMALSIWEHPDVEDSGLEEIAYAQQFFVPWYKDSIPEFTEVFLRDFCSKGDELLFYSGSFNPWHQGHEECLRQGSREGTRAIVCLDRNPFKDLAVALKKDALDSIIKVCRKQRSFLYLGFMALERKNPTVEWVSGLKSRYENIMPRLLMGADSFLSLRTWLRSKELLRRLRGVAVVPRNAESALIDEQVEGLKGDYPNLEVVVLEGHEFERYSSSSLRNER